MYETIFYISTLGKPASDKDIGHGNVLKKWPPASKLLFYYCNSLFKSFLYAASPEQKPLLPKEPVTRIIAKTTSPPTLHSSPSPFEDKDMMKEEKPVVKLHLVQKAKEKSQPLVNDGNKNNELDNIRLKKATKAPTVSNTDGFCRVNSFQTCSFSLTHYCTYPAGTVCMYLLVRCYDISRSPTTVVPAVKLPAVPAVNSLLFSSCARRRYNTYSNPWST